MSAPFVSDAAPPEPGRPVRSVRLWSLLLCGDEMDLAPSKRMGPAGSSTAMGSSIPIVSTDVIFRVDSYS